MKIFLQYSLDAITSIPVFCHSVSSIKIFQQNYKKQKDEESKKTLIIQSRLKNPYMVKSLLLGLLFVFFLIRGKYLHSGVTSPLHL